MTFIQVRTNESEEVLEKLICDAYAAAYNETLPRVDFGKVIVWNAKLFQELQLPKGTGFESHEERVLRCPNLPDGRTRLQLGSMLGDVFTSPPLGERELAARVHEGGSSGRDYVVRPFQYYNFHGEA